jgi:hypothetical protein
VTKTIQSAPGGLRATRSERRQHLPGDDLVPAPRWTYNHAVSIAAPPERVWPRLLQLARRRVRSPGDTAGSTVAMLKPGRALVLDGAVGARGAPATRAFYLYTGVAGTTRLLERGRAAAGRGMVGQVLGGALSRRTLKTIKRLVEGAPYRIDARAERRDQHRQRRLRSAARQHGIWE